MPENRLTHAGGAHQNATQVTGFALYVEAGGESRIENHSSLGAANSGGPPTPVAESGTANVIGPGPFWSDLDRFGIALGGALIVALMQTNLPPVAPRAGILARSSPLAHLPEPDSASIGER